MFCSVLYSLHNLMVHEFQILLPTYMYECNFLQYINQKSRFDVLFSIFLFPNLLISSIFLTFILTINLGEVHGIVYCCQLRLVKNGLLILLLPIYRPQIILFWKLLGGFLLRMIPAGIPKVHWPRQARLSFMEISRDQWLGCQQLFGTVIICLMVHKESEQIKKQRFSFCHDPIPIV